MKYRSRLLGFALGRDDRRADPHVRNLRHSIAGAVRAIAARADQRLVLRAAQSRPRRDLRHAQHHQFRAWRALHDGRVLRLLPAPPHRHRLLVGADHRADCGRHFWHDPGTDHAAMADWARPSLRPAAHLRAATENPTLVRAFGINVPRMITLTYGLGVGLAALAGVLSAPINQVRPLMGADLIIVVFAVVVIGGMGSIMGSIITGFALGVIEGLTKYFYPEASNTVVFVLMVLVLLVKPAGLTGRAA